MNSSVLFFNDEKLKVLAFIDLPFRNMSLSVLRILVLKRILAGVLHLYLWVTLIILKLFDCFLIRWVFLVLFYFIA